MTRNVDNYEAKANPAADDRRERPAAPSPNHQMLLDRLARKPAFLAPVPAPAAPSKIATNVSSMNASSVPGPQPFKEERRAAPRRRMLKGGVISYKGSFAGLRCTVRDKSNCGARLRMADAMHVPDQFELIIEIDGLYAKSQIVWRKGQEIGVRFTEPVRTGQKLREQVITPRD